MNDLIDPSSLADAQAQAADAATRAAAGDATITEPESAQLLAAAALLKGIGINPLRELLALAVSPRNAATFTGPA